MNTKFLITTVEDYNLAKMTLSAKDFKERCIVSSEVVSEILANECITNLYFEDSRLATKKEIKNLKLN